jgi:hypothetical protein
MRLDPSSKLCLPRFHTRVKSPHEVSHNVKPMLFLDFRRKREHIHAPNIRLPFAEHMVSLVMCGARKVMAFKRYPFVGCPEIDLRLILVYTTVPRITLQSSMRNFHPVRVNMYSIVQGFNQIA